MKGKFLEYIDSIIKDSGATQGHILIPYDVTRILPVMKKDLQDMLDEYEKEACKGVMPGTMLEIEFAPVYIEWFHKWFGDP